MYLPPGGSIRAVLPDFIQDQVDHINDDSDPEYRAMWQKKNGVWEIFNAMVLASSQFLGGFPTLSNGVRTITVIVDVIYLILYEIWEHNAD